jgi:single-stranded-DNA-specific exonuclease
LTETVLGVGRSLGGRRWLWHEAAEEGERIGLGIAQRLGLPEIVGRLLATRGVGIEAAADFLDPTLRALLPDPSGLADMDSAAERLAAAVRAGETVGVFGDYDVDGGCAAALLIGLLRDLGCPTLSHIPDRLAEGYGPNAPALARLVAGGAGLIVCVDCGTAAPDLDERGEPGGIADQRDQTEQAQADRNTVRRGQIGDAIDR